MGDDGGLGDAWKALKSSQKIYTWTFRKVFATGMRRKIESRYGPEVADAVEKAIRAGKDYQGILDRAERSQQAKRSLEDVLANPPPVHGAADWPSPLDLASRGILKPRSAIDDPSSILFGTCQDMRTGETLGDLHWDAPGHLVTVAPTRSGKSFTTIIPNLLRYRGSVVVMDPKSELYTATSGWRSRLGPVYRIAPFDSAYPENKGFLNHRYDPMSRVQSTADAQALAGNFYPPDPKATAFFRNDFISVMTAAIMMVKEQFPPNIQGIMSAIRLVAGGEENFNFLLDYLEKSADEGQRNTAALLRTRKKDSLSSFFDTARTTLAPFSNVELRASLSATDFTFESLKDRPATVYIDVPFELMAANAIWLRLLFKSAVDAMVRNRRQPEHPVLFILDEFLQLGKFDAMLDVADTHAGAGVRLWYFVQHVAGIRRHYGSEGVDILTGQAVKQFFGTDDTETAENLSRQLGARTEAYVGRNTSDSFSSGGDGSFGTSNSESVNFYRKPLLTSDEVVDLLSGWQGKDWRYGILKVGGTRPIRSTLHGYTAYPELAPRATLPPLRAG